MKISGNVDNGTCSICLNFGGDPVQSLNPGIFK